jgi:predicted transcriptional regulator
MVKIIETVNIKVVDLRKLCKKAKITLKQLSVEADVNYEYLCRINGGKHSMSSAYWLKLKNALDKHTSK